MSSFLILCLKVAGLIPTSSAPPPVPPTWPFVKFANRMALAYLKKPPIVQVDRIGIMGLSEGGLVAMWTLFVVADFKAAVLISPANISRAIDGQSFALKSQKEHL